MTAPSIAPADAELQRLEAALTAISANLVDLDDNPARRDLDKTRLTGRTAKAWADATEALSELWDGHRLLTEVVTGARALRDRRRMSDDDRAAFVHRVLGRSVTLSTTTVPLAQRGLLGAGQVVTTCSPAELLSAMEAAFATAVDVATRAGEVWHRLLPAAADAAAALDHVRGLGGSGLGGSGLGGSGLGGSGLGGSGLGGGTSLAEADRRLSAFTSALATDPLGVDENDLATVRQLVARADAERTSVTELRAELVRRLADAHRVADEVAAARRAADAALGGVVDRFPDRDIRSVRGADLGPDLTAIDALAAAGHWQLISPRLAAWNRRAREVLAALGEATAHNAGLLAARNELRGRLDAYRAKALRRGLGEHPGLTPLAEAARSALHTAPCDLDAARAAVTAYQDALSREMR